MGVSVGRRIRPRTAADGLRGGLTGATSRARTGRLLVVASCTRATPCWATGAVGRALGTVAATVTAATGVVDPLPKAAGSSRGGPSGATRRHLTRTPATASGVVT